MIKQLVTVVAVLALAACAPEITKTASAPKHDPAYQAPCVAGVGQGLELVGHFSKYGPYGSPIGQMQEPIDMYAFMKDFAGGPKDLTDLVVDFRHAYEDAPSSVGAAQAVLTEIVDLCTDRGVNFPSKVACSTLEKATSATYRLNSKPDEDFEGKPYVAYSPTVTFKNTSSMALELYVHGASKVSAGSGPTEGFGSEPEPDSQYWASESRALVEPGGTYSEDLGGPLTTLDVYGDQTVGGTSLTAEVREPGRVIPCELKVQLAK